MQHLTNAPEFGYTLYNFSVLGTGNPLTLEFAGRNFPGFFYLDDVSVTAGNGNSVPDAGSSALLLGLAVLGLIGVQRFLSLQQRAG